MRTWFKKNDRLLDSKTVKRVGIVHPGANIDSIPSIMNAVILLMKNGYKVNIFTGRDAKHITPQIKHRDVKIIYTDSDVYSSSIPTIAKLSRICRTKSERGIYRFILLSLNKINSAFFLIKNSFIPIYIGFSNYYKPYACFIGVDPWGLIKANNLVKSVDIPLVYYSLELLFSDEIKDLTYQKIKMKEQELCNKIEFAITQDAERATLLSIENNIPLDKIVLVPNAPLGLAQRNSNYYWHKRFNLSKRTKVVLYTGSLGDWTGLDKIIDSIQYWPEDWVFVIHTRYNIDEFSEEDEKLLPLRRLEQDPSLKNRIFISSNPVHSDEYRQLISGADIGIALYFQDHRSPLTQKNLETLGLSSGKIAYYLNAGLPVITNLSSGIGNLLSEYKCGIIIDNIKDIGRAVVVISDNYGEYSENAQNLFNDRFGVDYAFKQVITRLDTRYQVR